MSTQAIHWVNDLPRQYLSHSARALLMVYARAANDLGEIFGLPNATAVDRARLGRSTVFAARKLLEDRGFMQTLHPSGRLPGGRSKINQYKLNMVVPAATGRRLPAYATDRVRALADRAIEAAGMELDPSNADWAEVDSWIKALDRAGLTDDPPIEVIREERSKPNSRRPHRLAYYNRPIMRELERRARAAEAATTNMSAAAPPAEVIPLAADAVAPPAAPPPQPAARPLPSEEPAIMALALKALVWARIAKLPTPSELLLVRSWRDAGATAELTQAVIEFTLGRATAKPPETLHYFDREMREALSASSRHKPTSSARCMPISPYWKPQPNDEQLARDLGFDPALLAESFRNHYLASGKALADWDAGFRLWCRREHRFVPPPGTSGRLTATERRDEKTRRLARRAGLGHLVGDRDPGGSIIEGDPLRQHAHADAPAAPVEADEPAPMHPVNRPADTRLNGPESGLLNGPESGPESVEGESPKQQQQQKGGERDNHHHQPTAVPARARAAHARPLANLAAAEERLLTRGDARAVPASLAPPQTEQQPSSEPTSAAGQAKVHAMQRIACQLVRRAESLTAKAGLEAAQVDAWSAQRVVRQLVGRLTEVGQAPAEPARAPVDLTSGHGIIAAWKQGYFGDPLGRVAYLKAMTEAERRGFLPSSPWTPPGGRAKIDHPGDVDERISR